MIGYLDPSVISDSQIRVVDADGIEVAARTSAPNLDGCLAAVDAATREFGVAEWRVSANGFQRLILPAVQELADERGFVVSAIYEEQSA